MSKLLERIKLLLAEDGFTLLEIMMALTIMVIALIGTIASISSVAGMNLRSRNLNTAMAAAQAQLQYMYNYPFDQVLKDFSGYTFDVSRDGKMLLNPATKGEKIGRVDFPMVGTELREQYTGANVELKELFRNLNMGDYDINENGSINDPINDKDCSKSYRILPVRIRLRWRIPWGTQEYILYSVLWGPKS